LTTSEKVQPALASTARRLASTWRAWPSKPPATIAPVAGSSATCPEVNSQPSTDTACE
jgi:hypothetical protein